LQQLATLKREIQNSKQQATKHHNDMKLTKSLGLAIAILTMLTIWACTPKRKTVLKPIPNTPHPTFNVAESDQEAINLADSVVMAMGGRANWNAARFIHWNNYGQRRIGVDRKLGKARVTYLTTGTTVMLGPNFSKVVRNKTEITGDSIVYWTNRATDDLFLDSVWLWGPTLLKGPEMVLVYDGPCQNQYGATCECITALSPGSGGLPWPKVKIFINAFNFYTSEWHVYGPIGDEIEPAEKVQLQDYKPVGKVFMAQDQPTRGKMFLISTLPLPDSVFTSVNEPNWTALITPSPSKKAKKNAKKALKKPQKPK
jgi:hypothetical protein